MRDRLVSSTRRAHNMALLAERGLSPASYLGSHRCSGVYENLCAHSSPEGLPRYFVRTAFRTSSIGASSVWCNPFLRGATVSPWQPRGGSPSSLTGNEIPAKSKESSL